MFSNVWFSPFNPARYCNFGHYVISVPKGTKFKDYEAYKEYYDAKIKPFLEKWGVGGVVVFHPTRLVLRSFVQDGSPFPIHYYEQVWSPHFHFVGQLYIPTESLKAGLFVSKLRNLFTKRDVYVVLRYELTHTGIWQYLQKRKRRGKDEYYEITASKPVYSYIGLYVYQRYQIIRKFEYDVQERDDNNERVYKIESGYSLIYEKDGIDVKLDVKEGNSLALNFKENYIFVSDNPKIYLDEDKLVYGKKIMRTKKLKAMCKKIPLNTRNYGGDFFG
jgi:hypothetical protein